jgi:hypothetical protein
VRSFIPAFAEPEVVLHRHQFPPHPDDDAYRTFVQRVSRTNYERRWKHTYKEPGFKAHLLAILVFLVPKIGGASDLAIKIPTPETQDWYLRSMNHTIDVFNQTLHNLLKDTNTPIVLANLDLDTGKPVRIGDYPLADQTYAKLLERITSQPGDTIPQDLKQHILKFYGDFPEGHGALFDRLSLIQKMKVKGSP